MISFHTFYQQIADSNLAEWLETLPGLLAQWRRNQRHGDLPKWEKILTKIAHTPQHEVDFTQGVTIGSADSITQGEQAKLLNLLQLFHPWRKGPFQVHGIHIDTEWRSDWKWQRITPHIAPLRNRTVLDVGCGSGYHMWRILGQQAKLVVGVDPSSLFLCQFTAIKQLAGQQHPIHLLPLGIESLPASNAFDTVLSMGVLYHRRSPIDHLLQLKDQLRDGGELILETLIIDGDVNSVLMPSERYAQMNNVWFLPSIAALTLWLEKCGFSQVRCVNQSLTTVDEQRSTPWMRNESLNEGLSASDPSLTIEGYPAPKRATFIAIKNQPNMELDNNISK